MIGPKQRRQLLNIHRWVGTFCALFLILLSVTGLLLNHNVRLGLDRWIIRSPFILKRYGMVPEGPIESIRMGTQIVGRLDGVLYVNAVPIVKTGALIGGFEQEGVLIIGHAKGLVLLELETGDLIDEIELKSGELNAFGRLDSGREVFKAGDVFYGIDVHLSELEALEGDLRWSGPIKSGGTLPGPIEEEMLVHYAGEGISVYRVLLDVHAGRFFGVGGTVVMDLTAISVLYLVGSGLLAWRVGGRKGKRKDGDESASLS